MSVGLIFPVKLEFLALFNDTNCATLSKCCTVGQLFQFYTNQTNTLQKKANVHLVKKKEMKCKVLKMISRHTVFYDFSCTILTDNLASL